ncbi:MAG: winged helix-turn-helix domain-containing protein [Terracidiphilus sp.]
MERDKSASAGFVEKGCRFGGLRLEADGTLLRGTAPVALPPRELAALRLLLAHCGQVVTPLEFKEALWGDAHVSDDSLARCLASLRNRLEPEDCIQAVPKRGYRFSAQVHPLGGEPEAQLPRLAILPFATEFGVPEYLGSAVAEEAGVRLGAVRPAFVSILARDSVAALASRGLAPHGIGEMLKADYVLAGALSAQPLQYRLRAEMIRVEDGLQIWSEDRLVNRDRIAALESELAHLLAFRLQGPGLTISAAAEPDDDLEQLAQRREAYQFYQHARFEWQSLERNRMQDGLQHLLRAAELDPTLIAARVELAYLCVNQSNFGFMPPAVAAGHVRRAVDSIPDAPFRAEAILPALGWIDFHVHRNLPAALWSFARSAHLPHDPWITRVRTSFALSRRRFGEAIGLLRDAIHVDPWAAWPHARLAWAHHLAGDAAESLSLIRAALNRFPHDETVRLYGAIVLAFNGEAAQAVRIAQELVQRMPYFDLASSVHAYALAMAGRRAEARAILERLHWLGRERYVLNTFSAAAYVALDEPALATAELQAAGDMGCPWFFQMLADPRLKPLRGLPEFESMLGILAGMEAEAERSPIEE